MAQSRESTSKVAKLLGCIASSKFHESKVSEVIKTNPEPHFIILYYFQGTKWRANVGHVAVWDGERYFSYGKGNDAMKFWGIKALDEETASLHADNDKEVYGAYRKIILLVDETFLQKRRSIQEYIADHWIKSQYHMLAHNCVHMVYDFLSQAGILQIAEEKNKPTCPFKLKDMVRKIGEKQLTQIVQDEMMQPLNSDEVQNRRHFLLLLQNAVETFQSIEKPPRGLRDLKALLVNDRSSDLYSMKKDELVKLYYKVKCILICKNFDKVYSRSAQNQAFYNRWLISALNPESYQFAAPKVSKAPIVHSVEGGIRFRKS